MNYISDIKDGFVLEDEDLVDMFDRINELCFKNKLDRSGMSVHFSDDLDGCLGLFTEYHGFGGISICKTLRYIKSKKTKQLECFLAHEMVHWYLVVNICNKFKQSIIQEKGIWINIKKDFSKTIRWIILGSQHGIVFNTIYYKTILKLYGFKKATRYFFRMLTFTAFQE